MKITEGAQKVLDDFKQRPEEQKPELISARDHCLRIIRRDLPALSEQDQAAVAWYCAELVADMMKIPVGHAHYLMTLTVNGYALAAAQFLGWMDPPPMDEDTPKAPDSPEGIDD